MDIQDLLIDMALELSPLKTEDAVEAVGRYACQAIAGDDSGILVAKAKGKIETPVSTSQNVNKAHNLQADLDEGPCLDVIRTTEQVLYTGDVADDSRWPAWGPRCAELGYASAISVRLEIRQRRLGSLNVYATAENAFDSDDADTLMMLGTHASVALAAVEDRANLARAVDNRTTIGQAQGILMLAYDIEPDAAFAYLVRVSQARNVKLAAVARGIINNRSQVRRDALR